MTGDPAAVVELRTIRETQAADSEVPLYLHPEWAAELPWLAHGITARGGTEPFDVGFFGDVPVGRTMRRWRRLRDATGCRTAVHARQVHEATVLRHEMLPAGLLIGDDADGHITAEAGLLLTVSIADCVPISIVDEERRAISLLHGGWRGIAAGILEAGLRAVLALTRGDASALRVHFGPAICGNCYEVGPEVHDALGLPVPAAPEPVDLRRTLARRATHAGLEPERITMSVHCTRCGDAPFFSHRGGDRARQVAVLGVREARDPA
ncbi:MAG: polyphenol oxidase family protein [Longimicrobiales bacterium]